MYHIPNDKRAFRSAQLLYNGLLKELMKKTFEDVTIIDIVHSSGVGRATFYRLFDNISDILIWKCNEIMETTIAELKEKQHQKFKDAFQLFFEKWQCNTELLAQLNKNNRMDILWIVHEKYIDAIDILFFPDVDINGIDKEFLQGVLAGLIPIAFKIWIEHPDMQMDAMYEYLKHTFRLISSKLIV